MPPTPEDSPVDPAALEPGLRAARDRLGLSQEATAARAGAAITSYRRWETGKGMPSSPARALALSEVLETPMEVLWPPENDAFVAPALKALREQKALEEAQAREVEAHQNAEAVLAKPTANTEQIWTAPVQTPAPRRVPDPREHVRTLDGGDDLPAGATRPTNRRRRFLIPAAASLAIVAAAGTAIATTGDSSPDPPATPAAQISPSPAERTRAAQRTAMAQARDRGDFDGAITIATNLNDTAAATQLRATAGDLLARRARTAAERGDLPLATERLDKAEKRYGDLPAIDAVRRRIDAIKDAREKRAADRRRAAKKRAAGRAKAAAAARRRVPTQTITPPSSSRSKPTPTTPEPTKRAPSNPAPSSGSGGGSGSSGGSSSRPVNPGIF